MRHEARSRDAESLHPKSLQEVFTWFTRDSNGEMSIEQFLELQFNLHSRSQDHWFNERLRAYWSNRVKQAHRLGFTFLVLSCLGVIGCITTTGRSPAQLRRPP